MGFRTVIISSRAKLEYRLNSLIVRGDKERRIFVSEINTLIIQSTAVSLTAALLSELVKENVKVIFCDEKCNPVSELLPYYGAHNTVKRYKRQFAWDEKSKAAVWKSIIEQKILAQSEFLRERGFIKQADMLGGYAEEVAEGDVTNREGHAAKVYFNCLLGEGKSRSDDNFINGALNYGYAVLLSAFNREIAASGYLTQLGIWHSNEFNGFNLSCDLMEPLRPVVDRTAFALREGDGEFKKKMVNILNYKAVADGQTTTLDLAIRRYVKSVLSALDGDKTDGIVFCEDIEEANEL